MYHHHGFPGKRYPDAPVTEPDETCCPSEGHGYFCTLTPGHSGTHKAGVGRSRFVAEWDDAGADPIA